MKGNLRPPLSRLVGRQGELQELDRLFASDQRLVTLWGTGGAGKTRLAIAAGLGAQESEVLAFSGVWFCDLTEAVDLDGIYAEVARVLSLGADGEADGSSDRTQRIGRALQARGPVLLILDNLEQLVECAPIALSSWLSQAPKTRLLCTSRERLRIDGELVFPVPPLGLPAGDQLEASDAVQLFLQKMRELAPCDRVSDLDLGLIAEVVAKLDGLPLAIELAAARAQVLGLEGLRSRLVQPLDVLVDGARDRPGRQTTLERTIEWSWDLLRPAERQALAACSQFRGGFSLEAAEQILSAGNAAAQTLEALAALRDKSLLFSFRPAEFPGSIRFRLLEGIREFARQKLEKSELLPAVAERHATHYLDSAEIWANSYEECGDPESLKHLALELDNLMSVVQQGLGPSAPSNVWERGVRAALSLACVFESRGPLEPYLAILERLYAHQKSDVAATELGARLLAVLGKIRQLRGLRSEAESAFRQALLAAERSGATALEGIIAADLGVFCHQRRHMDEARQLYERAIRILDPLGKKRQIGRVLGNLGALSHDLGELEVGVDLYQRALSAFAAIKDPRLEGIFRANLAILEQERENVAEAHFQFSEALSLLRKAEHRRHEGITLGNLGIFHHELGELIEAKRCHQTALAILRSVGDRRSEAFSLGRLAAVEAALGFLDEARRLLGSAEAMIVEVQDDVALEAIRLNHAFVDFSESLRLWALDDEAGSKRHLVALLARMDRMKTSGPSQGTISFAAQSDDIRSTLRILDLSLACLDPAVLKGQTLETGHGDNALVVGPEAEWFRPPFGRFQDFRRRQALRLILNALVEASADQKAPLSSADLRQVGWPGEKMSEESAQNRVWVALATLRKLGLKDCLESTSEGYLLDPALRVVRSTERYKELNAGRRTS